MTRIGTQFLRWIAVGVIAAAMLGSNAGTALSIDSTDDYPAPPEALMGGQQAVLSVANVATSTCHAQLVFTNPRGATLMTLTTDVAPKGIQSLTFTPSIASTTRLTVLARVVSINASCTAFSASVQVVDVRSGRNLFIAALGDSLG